MAKTLTVVELANYLRGLVDAGVGNALIGARREDDNDSMTWVQGIYFAYNDDDGEPGILWLYVEDL
jgi:hypothetical protein